MLGWLGVTSNQCCIWKCIFGVTFNANMLVARCSPRSNGLKEVDPPLLYRRLAQVYTECTRPRPSFWSPPWLQDTCSQCRSMQKPWGSNRSYVGLLPGIELCRASLREDPYWWISSLHTDDRGKVSNPPYIHLHLSFKPLSTDHHNCLLYKSRWDALTTSSSASSPLARTVADRPLFLFKKHPGKIGAPKNGSVKKKKVICPDLLHRSVIDELLPSYVFLPMKSSKHRQ